MLVDTHTHLNFKIFEKDWREVVDRAIETGVEKMIVVGTDIESSKRAVEMSENHEVLYASVGVHPHHVRVLHGITNYKLERKRCNITDGGGWGTILMKDAGETPAVR